MFRKLIEFVDQYIPQLPTIEKMTARDDLLLSGLADLRASARAVDDLLNVIKQSFHPVVLFKGTMLLTKLEEGKEKRTAICDYAWAEKATKATDVSCRGQFIVSCQPDVTIKLQSLEVLNGPYDVKQCRIANVDLIATYQGLLPPGREIPIPEEFSNRHSCKSHPHRSRRSLILGLERWTRC